MLGQGPVVLEEDADAVAVQPALPVAQVEDADGPPERRELRVGEVGRGVDQTVVAGRHVEERHAALDALGHRVEGRVGGERVQVRQQLVRLRQVLQQTQVGAHHQLAVARTGGQRLFAARHVVQEVVRPRHAHLAPHRPLRYRPLAAYRVLHLNRIQALLQYPNSITKT